MFHWDCSAATIINTISAVVVYYFTYIALVPQCWPRMFWGYIWCCGMSVVSLRCVQCGVIQLVGSGEYMAVCDRGEYLGATMN